ncbi:MAG: helix-turn-helix domain-containing protein [Planctomycetota bacterium]|nr:helix-turn-helix domain-containing protein [Planctomycetota bacterium]MDA1214054.1 helix-turn-helix domain-containing protein [Planctomycetota bacterium]
MIGLQRIEVEGKRFVLLEEGDYERLCREAGKAVADDDALPEFPTPDANGRFPAAEYNRISMARSLISDRRATGMTQAELAQRAGVRQETISRLESGKHMASATTIKKIDKAIASAHKPKRSTKSATSK